MSDAAFGVVITRAMRDAGILAAEDWFDRNDWSAERLVTEVFAAMRRLETSAPAARFTEAETLEGIRSGE